MEMDVVVTVKQRRTDLIATQILETKQIVLKYVGMAFKQLMKNVMTEIKIVEMVAMIIVQAHN